MWFKNVKMMKRRGRDCEKREMKKKREREDVEREEEDDEAEVRVVIVGVGVGVVASCRRVEGRKRRVTKERETKGRDRID